MLSCRETVGEGGDVTGTVLEPGLSPSPPPALPPSSVIERDGTARTITQLTRGSPKRVLERKRKRKTVYTCVRLGSEGPIGEKYGRNPSAKAQYIIFEGPEEVHGTRRLSQMSIHQTINEQRHLENTA